MIAKTTAGIKVRRATSRKKTLELGKILTTAVFMEKRKPRQDIIIPLGPTLATTNTCEPRVAIAVVVAVVVSVAIAAFVEVAVAVDVVAVVVAVVVSVVVAVVDVVIVVVVEVSLKAEK